MGRSEVSHLWGELGGFETRRAVGTGCIRGSLQDDRALELYIILGWITSVCRSWCRRPWDDE
jgi:hypothetical protein